MRINQRWWVWLCPDCGGDSMPGDRRARCLRCHKLPSQVQATIKVRGINPEIHIWICPECGGNGNEPPDEKASCYLCNRTIATIVHSATEKCIPIPSSFVVFDISSLDE